MSIMISRDNGGNSPRVGDAGSVSKVAIVAMTLSEAPLVVEVAASGALGVLLWGTGTRRLAVVTGNGGFRNGYRGVGHGM